MSAIPHPEDDLDDDLPPSWLKSRLAVARKDFQSDGEWVHFADKVRSGDELWSFRTPADAWKLLAGCAGLALVRGGEIVERYDTLRS
jgi:hypothetical protein